MSKDDFMRKKATFEIPQGSREVLLCILPCCK